MFVWVGGKFCGFACSCGRQSGCQLRCLAGTMLSIPKARFGNSIHQTYEERHENPMLVPFMIIIQPWWRPISVASPGAAHPTQESRKREKFVPGVAPPSQNQHSEQQATETVFILKELPPLFWRILHHTHRCSFQNPPARCRLRPRCCRKLPGSDHAGAGPASIHEAPVCTANVHVSFAVLPCPESRHWPRQESLSALRPVLAHR